MNNSIKDIDKGLFDLLCKVISKNRITSINQIITTAAIDGYSEPIVRDALQTLVDNDMISTLEHTFSYGSKTQNFAINPKFDRFCQQ
ncbi:hypothetical protein GCM10008986_09800 [Salinibacillus aidingensis]|uniref:Uncharacterized protein n=1 Tax=Salinibacillus aidingensis TaxID=237684 RepID=A0ABN1AYG2_9BACI